MTQVAAAADASAEGARADRGRLVQLIVAAVLMGAAGVMLVAARVWALTFNGVMSKELRDLPYPGNLAAEGRRVFYTFAGVAIAIVVMVLASLLQKRKAPAGASREARTSTGKDPAE